MKKASRRLDNDVEQLVGVATLAETAEKDGAISRVFFAGRVLKAGIIPISDLHTLIVRPGSHKREYVRFTNEWPKEHKVAARVHRVPRYLCVAPAGVLDGVMYLGTDEVRWSPLRPGEQRKPVHPEAEGASCGSTCHDLQERNLRLARALNPAKSRRQRMWAMLGRTMYDLKHFPPDDLVVEDSLQLPDFKMSINLPYQKFKMRQDATDAVDRAERVIKAHSKGLKVVEEAGASILLKVNFHANEGAWLNDLFTEQALFTGMYRLGKDGRIECRKELPVGHEEDFVAIIGTDNGKPVELRCVQVKHQTYCENPSDSVNKQLDRLFIGPNGYIKFVPTVGKDWELVREGQPLWLPLNTPKKMWSPAELVALPHYNDLCRLAALATVKEEGKLAYASIDVVIGHAAWVDLDSAPRVQLVRHVAGLCHYSNGIRCNLARLDIEAHLRMNRASATAAKRS
jgi:hypothetical protein